MLIPKVRLFNLTPIRVDCIMELITEKFDDAVCMLESSCVIYGGTIRDILSNSRISGDLDVAVPIDVKNYILDKFNNSARWIPVNTINKKGSGFPTTRQKIISSVATFKNINGDEVQLINPINTLSPQQINGFDGGILDIVVNVDIKCCGVMSDIFGNVYELIPGAYEDCKAKILNFNSNIKMNEQSIELLKLRINKLVKRGWSNNININEIQIEKSVENKYTITLNTDNSRFIKDF